IMFETFNMPIKISTKLKIISDTIKKLNDLLIGNLMDILYYQVLTCSSFY
ncbi:12380_t:CDS:2, partial [Funneliformis geosporum]